jgi:hypothetical protein
LNQIEFFDTFADTDWHIQRQISHTSGMQYLFSGTASFDRIDATRLLYTESGTCKGKGLKFEAKRSYICAKESEFQIDVQFADGSPFYLIRCIELPLIKVDHLCGQDLYLGELEYHQKEIRFRWKVKGPEKNYYSSSLLIPEDQTETTGRVSSISDPVSLPIALRP